MTYCLCLATIPFCDALFSDTTTNHHSHPPQERYLLVEEKLDDGDAGGGCDRDDDDGVVANDPSDDVSSTAFSWTRKATSLTALSLMGHADAVADFDARNEEKVVDTDAGRGFPERFYAKAGEEAAMATLSNRSLDWSLLTSLNDKIILDKDDPYLVYEMDFTSEKVYGGGGAGPIPPPPPPVPYPPSPSSRIEPMSSSPESSPRTVRMIPDESGPYDVDTATKVRSPATVASRRTPAASLAASQHRRDRDVQVAIRSASAAESVDLVFVIDATGSMLKHIQNVKKSIRSIISKCRRTHSDLRLRLAAVAYRDLSDSVHYEVLDFCSSVERFEQFLGSLRAVGGADMPEDMATGIRHANRLSWAHPTRLVFIVADAPCHGIEFHDFDDDYPMGTPGVRIVTELQTLLASAGTAAGTGGFGPGDRDGGGSSVSLYFGRLSSSTDEMLHRWRSHYGIRVNVVPFTDVAKVTAAVTKAIRSAIFNTMTVTRRLQQQHTPQHLLADTYRTTDGDGRTHQSSAIRPKNFAIIPREPTPEEWRKRPVQAVNVFRNQPIRSIEDLYAPLRVSMLKIKAPPPVSRLSSSIMVFAKSSSSSSSTEAHMQMRRAAVPFAEGEVRVAFHGHLARTVQDLHDYDEWFASPYSKKSKVDGRFASMATVLKTLKHHGPGLNGRQQYLWQMEMSTIAGYLAELYNRTRRNDLAPIHVLNVLVVEEVSTQNERSGNRRFCAESPLPQSGGSAAPFTKYSSNAGYWNVHSFDESLLRFTEFTHQVTNRYLLVTDLQGVKGRDGHYYLTDPVILCQDLGRFGSTNLGGHFMDKCLASTRSLLEERGRYLV
jgi:Alpha-kinase family/von Willebrand factor type A domain